MIYTCPECGARYSTEDLKKAISSHEKFICCKYCNTLSQLEDVRTSDVAEGYKYLADAKFYEASNRFTRAVESAMRRGLAPSPDAYLGASLARFHVQTVFENENDNNAKLIVHTCGNGFIEDDADYGRAYDGFARHGGSTQGEAELNRISGYAHYVDDIKYAYDSIVSERGDNASYSALIAYEDDIFSPHWDDRGEVAAQKIYNRFSTDTYKIYLPNLDDLDEDKSRYEADLLYVIERANCLVVVCSGEMSARLKSVYERYFKAHDAKNDGKKANIAFVNALGSITLPDNSLAENTFRLGDTDAVTRFVAAKNGKLSGGTAIIEEEEEEPVIEEEEEAEVSLDTAPVYAVMDDGRLEFGSYPQKEVLENDLSSAAIRQWAESFPRPSRSDSAGWTVLYKSLKKNDAGWYRDEVADGKRYRLVYYTKLRPTFSVQDCTEAGLAQKANKYDACNKVRIFEFKPIIWEPAGKIGCYGIYISERGLDSKEFNSEVMSSDCDSSTLIEFLNGEFADVAFTDEQQEGLCATEKYGEDIRVFIPDVRTDKAYYTQNKEIKGITDYYKCVGGRIASGGGVNAYWVTDDDPSSDAEATVVNPSENASSTMYTDCTSVAVVPKIIIRL